ncbi:glycerol-3-phosphate 1-O-acyltransferase PlsY [candidate division WOR-3 bacterium]|nr:glycerol-3-phosphate 1-O-acyltransferase PlsY [candidate division WOR-3 bacterium]
MAYIVSFLIGLLFGTIPFSYMLGRMRGIDLKKVGSGNIGAANLGRTLGFPFFAAGFVLDALKGIVPVLLAHALFGFGTLAGAGAILGHIFNPFFGFHGGKGVATTIGVAVALTARSFLLALGIWLLVYLSTLLVSLASMCFAVALPLLAFILRDGNTWDRLLFIFIAALVIYAHRANIGRLINRKEPRTILWRRR